MTTYLVSFASKQFEKSQRRLENSALEFGFSRSELKSFRQQDIRGTEFYSRNRRILRQKKGAGYWLWKPYIILQTLAEAQPGDVVVYSDCGAEIISPLDPIIDLCRDIGGVLLVSPKKFLCRWHTKRDCFVLMGCDTPRYHDATMAAAGFNVFVKTPSSLEFVNEWLSYCEEPEILTDMPNSCGAANLPGFRHHRHDQSVLSVLAEREGIRLYRDPCQYGNYLKPPELRVPNEDVPDVPYSQEPDYESWYPTLLNQHWERQLTRSEKAIRVAHALKKRASHFFLDRAESGNTRGRRRTRT